VRSRLVIFLILFVSLVFGLFFARAAYRARYLPREQFTEHKLRVLTYSTFVGASGPGSAIVGRFQSENDCKVEILTAGDAGLLLERLKLAQAGGVPFDVVLGLDQLMLDDASERFEWHAIDPGKPDLKPEMATHLRKNFVPFDFSPLSFIYRQGGVVPPANFNDLLSSRYVNGFALQDPRSSSPGMQFFNWVKTVEGRGTVEFLQRFKPNVQSIAPSWSFSYGLFKKKQALFVFSYLTSLAFHWGTENEKQYQVVQLAEGHPLQIEYAAIPADCRECALADRFVKALLTADVQKEIMQKNFMFPVLKGLEAGTVFAELPKLKIIETALDKDLSEWDQVFKR
jgi:thiamine transport system substrate-binding protein